MPQQQHMFVIQWIHQVFKTAVSCLWRKVWSFWSSKSCACKTLNFRSFTMLKILITVHYFVSLLFIAFILFITITLSLSLSLSGSLCLCLSLSLSVCLSLSPSLSPSLSLSSTYQPTQPHIHTHTHTHSLSLSLRHTHTLQCTCTHTHTHHHMYWYPSQKGKWLHDLSHLVGYIMCRHCCMVTKHAMVTERHNKTDVTPMAHWTYLDNSVFLWRPLLMLV